MSTLDLAKSALGELFLIGFNGFELSDETAAFLSQARIGGTILFAQNYDIPSQLAELTNQIQECRTSEFPLWIGVDHEGGRVQRFKKGFSRIPDAASIGATNSPKLAFEIAEVMAKELRAAGVNLNFVPVCDIASNPKNPVIGNRSFGSNEEIVSKMASGFLRGHLVNGVQACVKHFPGHGDTVTDSHLALPRMETPLEILKNRELKPFAKAFKSHCSMVMTAHILNPNLDPEFPATLSSKTLRELLRKEMRYSRVVVSDDMEMKAITDNFGAEDAPRLAIQAGCDLLIYRSEASARHAYESLIHALEGGKLTAETVLEAQARVRDLKKEFFTQSYHPVQITEVAKSIGTPEHVACVEKVPVNHR
ncbi:MAG TPA: beta-N-acetylhexosaminidase [Bdellovibrionales bacterium]|nr:MAG: hypothetical protein A2Z97_03340 [Bdellovibrionales bacterium GWB1_52_6]OFZ02630.1 MAG: hypothetical protein A2X97_08250 [Bdellovibrionales bacterium GWA1_52_35]OFZ43913.1 MAG: hypothetical protein A2070_14145 [Bdellovibrionales bacterium GWC1_52_8]HAR42346.1 beta-N-acetylhexosaminidase [Bdellovibrionales bacterium]HCM41493.1 beta-N-acetylhexosaminidase [Bdellovibrionales bacterium]